MQVHFCVSSKCNKIKILSTNYFATFGTVLFPMHNRTLLVARDISLAMVQIAIFKRLPNLFKNPFLCMPNSISRIVWVERKLSAQI